MTTNPINRRAALGAIAALPTLASSPNATAALEAHPDAELFALARRAKALGLASDEANAAAELLEDTFEPPPPPACLLIREGDEPIAGAADGEFARLVGTPFSIRQLEILRAIRPALQSLSVPKGSSAVAAEAMDRFTRATEVDIATDLYLAEIEAAKEAAGIPAAEAKATESRAALKTSWREFALTPARTIEGALAKIDAVSHCYQPPSAKYFPNEPSVDDVLETAVFEFAQFRNAQEA
jgi:hypothetical protein